MAETQLVDLNPNHASYYRSHLYTSYHGINPLVTAAHPLLSIIDRLQLSRYVKADSEFYTNLQYELKVFQGRAIQAQYDEETVFIAHFLLSACINEKLNDAQQLNTFEKLMPPKPDHANDIDDKKPDEQFFEILDKVIDKPDHYLDLLELIYLCLSLGFEGKYKNQAHQKLKSIIENLYQTITKHRQIDSSSLFSSPPKFEEQEIKTVPRPVLWLITMAVFGAIFFSSNWLLDQKAMRFMSPTQQVQGK